VKYTSPLCYRPPYYWDETLSKGIHHRKGTAGLLISNIYVSVGIGIELLKWLAPIWPLTREGGKTERNRKRERKKRQKQEDGTTPTNLRVWCEVLVQTWHRLLIVHAQVSSVPPGTSHACLFHLLEQTYYSRFFHLSLPLSIYFHRVSEGKTSPNKWTLLLSKKFPLLSTGWNETGYNNWGN